MVFLLLLKFKFYQGSEQCLVHGKHSMYYVEWINEVYPFLVDEHLGYFPFRAIMKDVQWIFIIIIIFFFPNFPWESSPLHKKALCLRLTGLVLSMVGHNPGSEDKC